MAHERLKKLFNIKYTLVDLSLIVLEGCNFLIFSSNSGELINIYSW
jgi:hypothetical protein